MKWRDPLQFGGVSWRRTVRTGCFLCRHRAATSTGATADIMLHLVLAASALALSAAGGATRSTPVPPFVNLGTTTAVEELLDARPGSRMSGGAGRSEEQMARCSVALTLRAATQEKTGSLLPSSGTRFDLYKGFYVVIATLFLPPSE
jgi:hypothetical protein